MKWMGLLVLITVCILLNGCVVPLFGIGFPSVDALTQAEKDK